MEKNVEKNKSEETVQETVETVEEVSLEAKQSKQSKHPSFKPQPPKGVRVWVNNKKQG